MKIKTTGTMVSTAVICAVFTFAYVRVAEAREVQPDPLIGGFAPDPTICRAGDDFYLVNSSNGWYPGLPVYHSRDLRTWTHVSNVLDGPDWKFILDFTNECHAVWAPTLRYYDGTFYLACTMRYPTCGRNFVMTAKDIRGPWSKPHWPKGATGIDPSFFRDHDGKFYLLGNCRTPGSKRPHDQSIWIAEYDPAAGELIGEKRLLVNGIDPKTSTFVEGPHVYGIKGKYLLVLAEGGTDEPHAVGAFVSDSLFGPYRLCKTAPTLTRRDHPKQHALRCTGHADLVELDDGSLFAVFLGMRAKVGGRNSYLGRETFACKAVFTGDDLVFDDQNLVGGIVREKSGYPYQVRDPGVRLRPVRDPEFTEDLSVSTSDGVARGLAVYRQGKYLLLKETSEIRLERHEPKTGRRVVVARVPFGEETAVLRVCGGWDGFRFSYGKSTDSMRSIGGVQPAGAIAVGFAVPTGVGPWEAGR